MLTHLCHARTSLETDSFGFGGGKWDRLFDSSWHLVNANPISNGFREFLTAAHILFSSE
jgi:hypothetical protein